jgi:hypothetical protein
MSSINVVSFYVQILIEVTYMPYCFSKSEFLTEVFSTRVTVLSLAVHKGYLFAKFQQMIYDC